MHLLGPSLVLLLEYVAFCDASQWKVETPPTLYAWEGACVKIPCSYTPPGSGESLSNLTVYHNYSYDKAKKDFVGTSLYEGTALPASTRSSTPGKLTPCKDRVWFLGNTGNDCTLLIKPVKLQDSGTLGLRMVTARYKWMQALNLTVSERAFPPHIQLPPEIRELQEVTLTCSLNFSCSDYPIQLQWSLQGTEITSTTLDTKRRPAVVTTTSLDTKRVSTQSKLTLQAQWHYHGSNLTCRIRDPAGQPLSEKTVQLDVKHKPKLKIKVSPPDAIVTEGQSVTMTCEVISSNPEHQTPSWLKDGELLPQQGFTLTLSAVTRDVSGQYQCQARNYLGPGKSEDVNLQVHYAPKLVTLQIKGPTQIREGANVTLSCHYNSSNPEVKHFQWKLGSSRVPEVMHPQVVTMQNVAWNTGPVACAACNQWCSWAASVDLDVQYAPRNVVVQSNSKSETHSGQQVTLTCAFSSSHPRDVHFFWKKNGVLLEEGRKQLNLGAVTPEDAGSYHCLVNNSIGQTLSQAWKLQVLYAPRRLRVAISPQDGVVEGKKATLTCEGDANPPVSYYAWFDWNNQDLHHFHQTLTLEPVNIQHAGAYWCQGTNRLGQGQSPPSTLTVYYGPETIGRRTIMGVGLSVLVALLVTLGVKLQRRRKRMQSQQGLQESSSGQSFFVRNKKIRRAPGDDGPHCLGCYNPVMEDSISYAMLRFPDTPRMGNAGASEDTVTYSVVQKPPRAKGEGDYENVTPDVPEEEGVHYSELVHLRTGERAPAQDSVEYVTLKH
ncbi:PREDICTED: B-cell receptor CD22 [Condylura cristata]|uniref:B-cell receptor CD22 n=1 Tax=Condylura cristata TaxID=143302 RepID=UPI000642C317|nr:PREDICTED: B-cell receptor CD22 [Condylura cristata]